MTIHTGQSDLYKCRYCPKTYRFSSSIALHKKTAHPEERNNEQVAMTLMVPPPETQSQISNDEETNQPNDNYT